MSTDERALVKALLAGDEKAYESDKRNRTYNSEPHGDLLPVDLKTTVQPVQGHKKKKAQHKNQDRVLQEKTESNRCHEGKDGRESQAAESRQHGAPEADLVQMILKRHQ